MYIIISENIDKNRNIRKIKHPGLLYENHVQNYIQALDKSGY